MELRDIYDINREKTGDIKEISYRLKEDEYLLSVHICIFNSKDEMLIQKRQSNMKTWKNKWELTSGGLVSAGENSNIAGEREIFEELGIKIDLKNIRPHLTLNFPKGFDDIFLVNMDLEIEDLILQEDEVKEVKWASYDEIIDMIDKKEFVPYYHSIIKMLFDIRNSYSSYSNEEDKFK